MDPVELDEHRNSEGRGPMPVFGGRYEARRHLARGGMADVYEARDVVLDRKVAVKVLFPQFANDPRFAARFRREATSAARLSHPDIVQVYDWGPHDESFYIAMEYVEGVTLAEMLSAKQPMPIETTIEIAAAVAGALDYAHTHGTIHRDIKPANILVRDSNRVKVADFGIARTVEGDENLTEAGTVLGTAAYFSPEQAQGWEVDPRSDLYSLGVILFEMLTGAPPFEAQSPVAVAMKHVRDQAPRPISLNPAVPPELDDLVMRLLAKDPDERPPTARVVADALGHRPIGSHAAALAADQQRAADNRQPVDDVAAASAAAMSGASTGTVPQGPAAPAMSTWVMPATQQPDWRSEAYERRPEPEQSSPRSTWWIFAIAFLLVGVVAGLIFLPTITDQLTDLGNGGTEEQPVDTPADTAPSGQSTTTVEETTSTDQEQTSSTTSTTDAPTTAAPTTAATTASTTVTTATTATTAAPTTAAPTTTSQ